MPIRKRKKEAKIEYQFIDGCYLFTKGADTFVEDKPNVEEAYDYGSHGVFVYLEERDDEKAKQVVVDYYMSLAEEVKNAVCES